MTYPPAFQEIADNLDLLDDWEDRYRYIIELGQAAPSLAAEERSDGNRVPGCVSQVWLVTEGDAASIKFRGESDAMIVRGLVAILIALYSGRPASEVASTNAIEVLDELGLREHLSTQRSNGLVSMVDRMRTDAKRALSA